MNNQLTKSFYTGMVRVGLFTILSPCSEDVGVVSRFLRNKNVDLNRGLLR